MTRSCGENQFGTLNAYAVDGGEVAAGDRYGYKVICVVHSVRDKDGRPVFWSAYRGFTSWSDEHVASNGDIIPHEAATLLFPTIDRAVPNYQY